jgi:hypothetical protein
LGFFQWSYSDGREIKLKTNILFKRADTDLKNYIERGEKLNEYSIEVLLE